ncbi:MAG: sigma-54-dependent Fis family transcriptional regulator [Candidatus Odyssella sp.]|nr:sigma-54-dependent Fis family transcriptional regulator [Candidatus Odyssella sp.]
MAQEILIVDDEADIRTIIADTLQDEGYETRVAGDADSALAAIRMRRPSLVLLDIWLEGSRIDGMGVLDAIRAEHPSVPVVMISGHGTVELAVAAIRKGAYDFLEKPFKTDRLLVVCQRAVEAARLRRENEELKFRAGVDWNLVGNSPAVVQVNQMIERVAPTNSRVLITGPAGAGKEVVARLIHARSLRRDGPFVVLNCATMHPDRMESELFGAEGPLRKVGTLEEAHGGTLLLDEVGDMPVETQGKFLRVLQDQVVRRVNGAEPCKVDVRVIASTAKDLNALIEQGRFREDLLYRLRVVPIDVPPLRGRREDIPALARHLMATAAQRAGLPARVLGEDAIAAFQAYSWPGNVRQLCNVIDWLLIMTPPSETHIVSARQLPPEIIGAEPPLPRLDKSAEIMTMPLREAREAFEREYLMAQIARFGGNISRTAAFIGMERSALHRKLKLLGVADAERGEARARSYDA